MSISLLVLAVPFATEPNKYIILGLNCVRKILITCSKIVTHLSILKYNYFNDNSNIDRLQ